MGKKLYPTNTVKQAQSILSAWQLIDPSLKIGTLTLEAIAADVAAVQELRERLIHMQNELTDIRNQRDALTIGLWSKVKRTRDGVRGIYGDDSAEYELVGGTRRSEKKKPQRRSLPGSPK